MAYNTSQRYKEVIYSGGSKNRLKIWFNNVELEDADRYCEKVTRKPRILPDDGNKKFTLDNFVSQELEIILHNIDISMIQDKVEISIGTLVESNSLGDIYEDIPLGIFNIQDEPVTDKNKITITLRDNAVKFDFGYDGKSLIDANDGKATKMQILQDICIKAGVVCGVDYFNGMDDKLGTYDNTITARIYVSYLAEQAGMIATIDRDGKLIFVNINGDEATISGTNIEIEDALDSKLINFELKGNTEQDGTPTPSSPVNIETVTGRQEIGITGKNLFDKNNATIFNAYIGSTTIASDSNNRTTYIKCLPNTTYTISKTAGARFKVAYTYTTPALNTNIYGSIQNNTASSITVTTDSQAQYLVVWYYNSNDTITDEEMLGSLQIEQGSTATEYEPYQGNTYEINLGKNLFDKDNIKSGYYLNASGVETSSNSWGISNYMPVISGNTYTYQGITSPGSNAVQSAYYDSSKTLINVFKHQTGANTITIPNNVYFVRFSINLDSNNQNTFQLEKGTQATTYSPFKQINLFDKDNANEANVWINQACTSAGVNSGDYSIYIPCKSNTTYNIKSSILIPRFRIASVSELITSNVSLSNGVNADNKTNATITTGANDKYLYVNLTNNTYKNNLVIWDTSIAQYPIELCKIGDYQDYIYKNNNVWYKHKAIGKVVLDGSENWYSINTNSYYITTRLGTYPTNQNWLKSNYFKSIERDNIDETQNYITISDDGNIRINYLSISSANELKTWLSNNNTTIYYVLNNAIGEEITDEELIEQLNDIYNIRLAQGINYINISSNDLSAILNINYYKQKETVKIPLSIVEKYEIGDKYKIQRVVYEDAIRKFETSNDETLDTLYINSANPYINNQEQIENIYDMVKNFEIDSLTTGKILGDPSIDAYDIIEIYGYYDENNRFVDDKTTIVSKTLANHISTYNGGIINEYDTQIGKEERTENVTLKGEATFQKYAKTNIDNINNNLSLLVAEQNETTEKITQIIQDVNSIQNLFQVTGGNNLIKNSVGLFGDSGELSYWDISSVSDVIYGEDNTLIGTTISASKISICNSTIQTSTNNIVGLTLDTIKSLNYKVKQDADTITTIKLYGLSLTTPLYQKTFDEEMDWQEIYDDETSKFFIDSSNLTLVIESTSTYDGRFEISDLILNDGEKQLWSPATGEVWGEVVKLNQNGISVYSLQGGIATLMASQGFQVRELNGGELGSIITQLTKMGLITLNIESTGKIIQKNLIYDVIDYEGHETYISYIRSGR